MKMILKNCHIVSPAYELENAAVEIEDGIIRRVYASGETLPAGNHYDAKGLTAIPGFIDMHFHGSLGFDISDGEASGVEKIAECKLKEGVTSMVPATLTLAEETLAKSLSAIASYAKNPKFCKVPGVHLEGPYVNPAWKGAQNPAFIRNPDINEVLRLNKIMRVLLVTFAIESEGGLEFVGQLRANGIVPSCGHSGATHAQFVEAHRRGLSNLTHFCNQMSPLHHREIGLVGSGLSDDGTMIEMICDKLHLSPPMVALAFKVKPLDKIALITDSLAASWLPDGPSSIGGLPVVVKNGEARLASNGALAGSCLKFNIALKNAAEISGLPLKDVVRTSSLNQAQALGLDNLGRIAPGYAADLVLLDKEFSVKQVFVDGVAKI